MKQSDWQNAFGPAPESFRECVDQTLNRLEDKEMRKRTKFTTALVAAALITALLASAAIAAGNLGIWRYLYTGSPIIPLEGADEMVATDVASAQNEYFRISVEEAVYDGFGAILKLNAAPVNPEKYVLLNSHTIAADLANPEDYILEPNPELGGEGWSSVVGVKDGRQIICMSSPIVTVDGTDTAETLDLFNSRWEENNEDGSIDYWISSSFHENLPEKLPVRITVKGYDLDMNNTYGALDDLTFTLQKTHQERKVKLIPTAPIAENNIEIHDLGITFTDVRGYICAHACGYYSRSDCANGHS